MKPTSPGDSGASAWIRESEWVSRALGAPVYDVDLRRGKFADAAAIGAALDEIEHSLRQRGAKLAAARLAPSHIELVRECERRGFFYVETVVALTIPLKDDGRYGKYARFPLRLARESDLPALAAIGKDTFTENRFMTDPNFPPGLAARYYANWLEDSLARDDDQIFVLEAAEEIKGFYIVRKLDARRVDLLLAGVKKDERASFYGLPLYAGTYAALAKQGFTVGETEVLATNLAAINIFVLFGARFVSAFLRLHKWY